MVLYKYTNHHGVDVLLNSEVKITPFNQLNDPLEITPFTRTRTEEEAKQQLKTPEGFEAAKRKWPPGPANQAAWNDHVDRMTPRELQSVIQNQLDVVKRIPNDASKKFGLLCLSEGPDNILMWSHYSDGHRGMVIGLEKSELGDDGSFFPVDYPPDNARVEWKPFLRQGDPDFDNYLKELPRTKGLDWKYEQEWRAIYSLDHEKVTLRRLGSGGVGYFLKIPASAIREVCLGYRCPVETESAVKHLIKRNKLSVRLERAEIHQTKSFEIRFVDLPLD